MQVKFNETSQKEKYNLENFWQQCNSEEVLYPKDLERYACADIFYPQRYFMTNFGAFPSKMILDVSDEFLEENRQMEALQFQLNKFLKALKKKHNVKVISDCNIDEKGILGREQFYVIIEDESLILYVEPLPARCVIYHNDYEKALKWSKIMRKYYNILLKEKVIKKKIGIIYKTQTGYDIMERSIKHYEVDIHTNYNDDFVDADAKIRNFLDDDNKGGLVILNGTAGSGKTTYIRNLIDTTARDFIFLTKDMASALADPGFVIFMERLKNSVLIIEDCENLVASREQGNEGVGISNVLNLCDGILGDVYNIKIICTFNTEIKNVDSALLREGRLVCRYQFGRLNPKKACELLNKLGVDNENIVIDESGMSLAEIYNFGNKNGGETKRDKKIGFNVFTND